MSRPVAHRYLRGYLYELRSDGSLYRRSVGGDWELVSGRMSDWPEAA